VDRSELDRRTKRIVAISEELATLYSQTQPAVSIGSIGIWIVSGGLGVAGVALAAPTGGSSLLLSVLGMLVFLIDMARQVQATAHSEELRRYARQLEQELRDHAEFLRRFGRP
jgi:hypothetical protein